MEAFAILRVSEKMTGHANGSFRNPACQQKNDRTRKPEAFSNLRV